MSANTEMERIKNRKLWERIDDWVWLDGKQKEVML